MESSRSCCLFFKDRAVRPGGVGAPRCGPSPFFRAAPSIEGRRPCQAGLFDFLRGTASPERSVSETIRGPTRCQPLRCRRFVVAVSRTAQRAYRAPSSSARIFFSPTVGVATTTTTGRRPPTGTLRAPGAPSGRVSSRKRASRAPAEPPWHPFCRSGVTAARPRRLIKACPRRQRRLERNSRMTTIL